MYNCPACNSQQCRMWLCWWRENIRLCFGGGGEKYSGEKQSKGHWDGEIQKLADTAATFTAQVWRKIHLKGQIFQGWTPGEVGWFCFICFTSSCNKFLLFDTWFSWGNIYAIVVPFESGTVKAPIMRPKVSLLFAFCQTCGVLKCPSG